MSAAVSASHLQLDLAGEPILRDVDFKLPRGSFVSILGPSGCGKTSLLRIIAGLQPITGGQLEVTGGHDSDGPPVGYVFQDPTLLPWRTVRENVGLPLELSGRPASERDATVSQALRTVGLNREDHHKFPRMLSGGMRMRVSLARALVDRPDVMLFDEPFAALDDLLRQRLGEDLLEMWQQERFTAVFVTHNVGEAVFLSQQVLVMDARPATIVARHEIPFAYPRPTALRGSAEFAELTARLSRTLRGEVA